MDLSSFSELLCLVICSLLEAVSVCLCACACLHTLLLCFFYITFYVVAVAAAADSAAAATALSIDADTCFETVRSVRDFFTTATRLYIGGRIEFASAGYVFETAIRILTTLVYAASRF